MKISSILTWRVTTIKIPTIFIDVSPQVTRSYNKNFANKINENENTKFDCQHINKITSDVLLSNDQAIRIYIHKRNGYFFEFNHYLEFKLEKIKMYREGEYFKSITDVININDEMPSITFNHENNFIKYNSNNFTYWCFITHYEQNSLYTYLDSHYTDKSWLIFLLHNNIYDKKTYLSTSRNDLIEIGMPIIMLNKTHSAKQKKECCLTQ